MKDSLFMQHRYARVFGGKQNVQIPALLAFDDYLKFFSQYSTVI